MKWMKKKNEKMSMRNIEKTDFLIEKLIKRKKKKKNTERMKRLMTF
jgi:hypothetical protein